MTNETERPVSSVTVRELVDEIAARLNMPATVVAHERPRVPLADAARDLGCSERQARRLVADRRLESVRIGKKTMITRESLDRLLKESTR